MMALIRRYQLRKAFQSYIYQLGPALVQRYGSASQFTAMQINSTVQHLRLSKRYLCYAVALYSHEHCQIMLNVLHIEPSLLQQRRTEIAAALFDGNINYRATQVLAKSRQPGWRGGAAPDWRANRIGKTSL